jgi:hypothetical protein
MMRVELVSRVALVLLTTALCVFGSESGRARVLLEATSDQLAKMVRVHSASLFNVSEAHVFSRMENQTDKQVNEKCSQ